MKGNNMQRNFLIATLGALLLSACSSTGTLQSTKPENRISGTVTRGLIQPYRVEVTLDDKVYRGEWRTGAPTKEQKTEAGHTHRFHVGQVRSTLGADDGSKIECHWLTHGETGDGACQAGGREYPLILK
jgi:hypothetical protein